jgi:hypothetical protein
MRNIIIPLVTCIPAFGFVVAETPATYSHISEAVEIVNSTTGRAPTLFSAEKLQLTHRVIGNLSLAYQNKSIVDLFTFGQESIFVNTVSVDAIYYQAILPGLIPQYGEPSTICYAEA